MTVSLTIRAKAEIRVKEDIRRMDEAIAHLRQHSMVETADRLANIRDFLARSESYYRRVEDNMRKSEMSRNTPVRRAERMWLDVTGSKRK